MIEELLILVNKNDDETGLLDKLSVHREGLLHRAFSVFIFNSRKELLLQQRAFGKYHSAGLWSNTCCSHPRAGESITYAISRRLQEEMGMVCDTQFQFKFIYQHQFENGLTEHECDHVYFGSTNQQPVTNEEEVRDYKYISLAELEEQIHQYPDQFTAWLKICLPMVKEHYNKMKMP